MRMISSTASPISWWASLLVVAGIKLLGLHPAKKADPNEADTLPPYRMRSSKEADHQKAPSGRGAPREADGGESLRFSGS